ncbi:hypothetical protein ACYSNO_07885 [Enterococcus sp. LJL98]
MEILVMLIVGLILLRFIIKTGSFLIRILALGLLVIGLWYFRYEIVNQLDELSRTFSLENWFSGFFNWIEQLWSNGIKWLNH